jgi:hypothetical protein
MDSQGMEFAEQVRIRCTRALLRLGNGHADDAVQIISDLCGEAEAFVHGAKMGEEQAALREDRFDLAALRVDLRNGAPESED